MPQFIPLIVILKVYVYQVPDPPVHIVHVLVLKVWNFVFSEIPESLQSVEAAREMVEDHTQDLHQSHMVVFKNGSFTNIDFHIPAFDSRAFENDTVLLFGVRIYDPH